MSDVFEMPDLPPESGALRAVMRTASELHLENQRLHLQVKELQTRMTEMVEAQSHRTVRAFMAISDQPIGSNPAVPDEPAVRFRLKLVAEEFCELLEACAEAGSYNETLLRGVRSNVMDAIDRTLLDVDLPCLADACGDLDYVVEGLRQTFGIHGPPVAREIHEANMRKFPMCEACVGKGRYFTIGASLEDVVHQCEACNGKGRLVLRRSDGKVQKPEGWRGPDVEGVLRNQGWRP